MKIRKILSFALIIIMLFSVFASCSKPKDESEGPLDPKNPVSITLWHYYVGDLAQALELAVSEFNSTTGKESGVVVEAIAKGTITELGEAVTQSATDVITAEPMPDIFSSYADKATELDALGVLCDLKQLFTEEQLEGYVSDFLQDGIIGGKLIVMPVVKSTELLYINDTTWRNFAAATGTDKSALTTWEGVYETAREYYNWTDSQTEDIPWDGSAFIGVDSLANYIVVGAKQLGLEVISADEQSTVLDITVLHRIFSTYYNGYSLGYFDSVSKFRSDDIKSGDIIAYVASSSGAANFPTWIEVDNARMPIDFAGQTYPHFEGGESYAIQQGAGMCIAKNTPAKEAGAALFLAWFTDVTQNT